MLNESYGVHGQEVTRTLHSESLISCGLALLLSLKVALKNGHSVIHGMGTVLDGRDVWTDLCLVRNGDWAPVVHSIGFHRC